jgi:hypothetical protein
MNALMGLSLTAKHGTWMTNQNVHRQQYWLDLFERSYLFFKILQPRFVDLFFS